MTSELKPCPFCLVVPSASANASRYDPKGAATRNGRLYQPQLGYMCFPCGVHRLVDVPFDDQFGERAYEIARLHWNTRAVPDVPEIDVNRSTTKDVECQNNQSMTHNANVPELDRYRPAVYMEPCLGGMFNDEFGEYALYSQAAEIIAANRAEKHKAQNAVLNLERKLAQYEAQEPIGWIPTATVKWLNEYDGSACAIQTAVHNKPIKSDGGVQLYTSPAPAADLKAENEKLREALEFYADTSKYPAPLTGGMGDLWSDCGQIARAALNVETSNDKA